MENSKIATKYLLQFTQEFWFLVQSSDATIFIALAEVGAVRRAAVGAVLLPPRRHRHALLFLGQR